MFVPSATFFLKRGIFSPYNLVYNIKLQVPPGETVYKLNNRAGQPLQFGRAPRTHQWLMESSLPYIITEVHPGVYPHRGVTGLGLPPAVISSQMQPQSTDYQATIRELATSTAFPQSPPSSGIDPIAVRMKPRAK